MEGSSNAATIIHCLENLYNFKIKKKELDFFIIFFGCGCSILLLQKKRNSYRERRKNFFYKKKLLELPVVLINPLIEISTRQIFENLFLKVKKRKI